MIGNRRAGTLALALLLVPAAVAAQARPAATTAARPAPTAEEVQGWIAELQEIGTRLQAAHTRALQDAQLRRTRDELMHDMEAEMLRIDPELDRVSARVRAIDGELRAARQANDRTRFQALAREFQAIRERVLRVETLVRRQPALAARERGFEELLRREMQKVEPELDALLERSRELQARVAGAQQARQQAAPGPRRRTP